MILRKNNANMNEQQYLDNIANANQNFLNFVMNNNGMKPIETPVEIHPYLSAIELQDFEKYIIGTFPPISYVRDLLNINDGVGNIPSRPITPFFHGNDNDLWKLLLSANESNEFINTNNRIAKREFLINLLPNNNINYSDIISSVKRRIYSPKDIDLENIIINENLVFNILISTISKYLFFDTSSVFNTANFNCNNSCQSFNIFIEFLKNLNFNITVILNHNRLDINNPELITLFKTKVLTKLIVESDVEITLSNSMKIKPIHKEFIIITSASPSGNAARALGKNPIYTNWKDQIENQNIATPTNAFRKKIYSHFRNNEWDQLEVMNL